MKAIVAISLSLLFAALATFNVITILESSRPARAPWSRARAALLHRIGGYLFIGLFAAMLWFMSKRLIGYQGDFTADMIVHIGLALLLAPLLFVKVLIARRYKNHQAMLMPLGLSIYAITIVLVFMRIVPYALSRIERSSAIVNYSMVTLVLFFIFIVTLAFRPSRPSVSAPSPTAPSGSSSPLADPRAGTFPLELTKVDSQTHNAKTLCFRPVDRRRLQIKPGQFLTFHLNVDGKKVIRSYTICSSPLKTDHIEITPKRAHGGCASVFLNERAAPGLVVQACGPFGHFYFDESRHTDAVFIAGGSGITPMMAMLRYIEDRALSTRVTLIYSVRTPEDIIFREELTRSSRSLPHFRSVITVSNPGVSWTGNTGRLSKALLQEEIPDFGVPTFFLCGPKAFMQVASEMLKEQGVGAERIKQESFGEGSSAAIPPASGNLAFDTIEFLRSGQSVKLVAGMTVLELAESSGISIPSGCRQGQCGTCATHLLGGSVTMRVEDGLTIEQKKAGFILPCVSTANDSICLDA
jgi:ferredoxin-NADP reductase